MAKSGHTFSKRQREKDKAKKRREKRERMDERKMQRQNGERTGPTIDWDSAPVNVTLSDEDMARRAAVKPKDLPPPPSEEEQTEE